MRIDRVIYGCTEMTKEKIKSQLKINHRTFTWLYLYITMTRKVHDHRP